MGEQKPKTPASPQSPSSAAADGAFGAEAHWGDPEHAQARENFFKGEVLGALVWLSVAAAVSLIIEVVFLGSRVNLGGVALPVPWTIPLAYVANLIITNTALLWTRERSKASVPVIVWAVGFGILLLWSAMPFGGDMVLGQWLRTVVLLAAGVLGGAWPLRHAR
nr:hypothetical protein [Corynebacterium lactis]